MAARICVKQCSRSGTGSPGFEELEKYNPFYIDPDPQLFKNVLEQVLTYFKLKTFNLSYLFTDEDRN